MFEELVKLFTRKEEKSLRAIGRNYRYPGFKCCFLLSIVMEFIPDENSVMQRKADLQVNL